jgi:hypothetical protein
MYQRGSVFIPLKTEKSNVHNECLSMKLYVDVELKALVQQFSGRRSSGPVFQQHVGMQLEENNPKHTYTPIFRRTREGEEREGRENSMVWFEGEPWGSLYRGKGEEGATKGSPLHASAALGLGLGHASPTRPAPFPFPYVGMTDPLIGLDNGGPIRVPLFLFLFNYLIHIIK